MSVRKGLVVGACVGVVLLLLPLAKVGHERWRQAVQDAEDAAHHAFLSLQEDVRPTASAASVLRRLQAAELAAEMRREEKAREDRRRARLLRQREEVSSDAEAPAPDEGALPPDAGMELAPSEEMGLAPSDLAPSDGEEGDNPDDAGDEDLEAAHPRRKRKHQDGDEPSGVAVISGHRAGGGLTMGGLSSATGVAETQTPSRLTRGGLGAAAVAGRTPAALSAPLGMQAAALGPAIAGAGRLGAGAPFRGPALAPGLLPARAARAPSAYLTGVTPALSGIAMGDGAFPATASVGSGRQAQLGTPAVTAAAVGVQPGIAAGRSSSAGLVAPTIGGVTDVARPTAIVGSAASVGPPSTPAAVVGTDIPTAPVAASVSATSSQFGTVPGTNIPVVPSTASADLVPAMQTAGSGTLTGTTSVPVDQDGLVSYGAPAGAPVVLPPSPPPRLRFGADSSRITGAGSDDPANSAGNNNVFGIDRSRAASPPAPAVIPLRGRVTAVGPAAAGPANATGAYPGGSRLSVASIQSSATAPIP